MVWALAVDGNTLATRASCEILNYIIRVFDIAVFC